MDGKLDIKTFSDLFKEVLDDKVGLRVGSVESSIADGNCEVGGLEGVKV